MRTARRPQLKVVASPLDSTPRHRAAWPINGGKPTAINCEGRKSLIAVEVFPEAEWDAMHPATRPPLAAFLPGIGFVVVDFVGAEEGEEIAEEHRRAREEYLARAESLAR